MIQKILSQIRLRYLNLASQTVDRELTNEERIELALIWFKQTLLPSGGSSAKYSMMFNKFFPAYPETTGFWLNTLIIIGKDYPEIYKRVFNGKDVLAELTEWLLSVQRLDGTFPGSFGDYKNQPPRVFNNGQIILGLQDYYNHFKNEKMLAAAVKSAEWLLKIQEDDGAWRQFTLHQLSSNTRTAWALIRLAELTGENKFKEAGIKNIDFALSLQSSNGYFNDNGFDEDEIPTTHTIGYALRGIVGAGIDMKNEKWIDAAARSFDSIIPLIRGNGFLPGELDEDWKSNANYCCLTGNCQLSVVGFFLAEATGNSRYSEAANRLIDFVKTKQLMSLSTFINGGISGSWPVSGGYCAYDIPNWAARFFVDALILQNRQIKS